MRKFSLKKKLARKVDLPGTRSGSLRSRLGLPTKLQPSLVRGAFLGGSMATPAREERLSRLPVSDRPSSPLPVPPSALFPVLAPFLLLFPSPAPPGFPSSATHPGKAGRGARAPSGALPFGEAKGARRRRCARAPCALGHLGARAAGLAGLGQAGGGGGSEARLPPPPPAAAPAPPSGPPQPRCARSRKRVSE